MDTAVPEGIIADLRSRIESAAQDSALAAGDRARLLLGVRARLVDALGAIDQYVAGLDKVQQAGYLAQHADIAQARENADAREELLAAGSLDARELDEAGFLSHAELDRLDEEGLLLEAVGELRARWDAAKHPRGRGGKFRDTIHDRLAQIARDGRRSLTSYDPSVGPTEQEKAANAVEMRPFPGGERVREFLSKSANAVPPRKRPPDPAAGRAAAAQDSPDAVFQEPLPKRDWILDARKDAPDPTLSAKVKAIKSQKDAEAYLGTIGVEAQLDGITSTKALRQIAQAVTDAKDRFPSLSGGRQGKLAGVKTWRAVKHKDPSLAPLFSQPEEQAFAVTGPDPERGDMRPDGYDLTDATKSAMSTQARGFYDGAGGAGADTWIVINEAYTNDPPPSYQAIGLGPTPLDSDVDGSALVGGTAVADRNVYGRIMHELGHAVSDTNGESFRQPDAGPMKYLNDVGAGPGALGEVSHYTATNPNEAWAEVFATLNSGAADTYSEPTRRLLFELRAWANHASGKKLL